MIYDERDKEQIDALQKQNNLAMEFFKEILFEKNRIRITCENCYMHYTVCKEYEGSSLTFKIKKCPALQFMGDTQND